MLVPLFAATGGFDPPRPDAEDDATREADDAHIHDEGVAAFDTEGVQPVESSATPAPAAPSPGAEPPVDATSSAEPPVEEDRPEPSAEHAAAEPVALVPAAGATSTALPDDVRPALRNSASAEPTAPEPADKRPPVQRFVLALLLIAAAGLIGYVLSKPSPDQGDPDTIARSVEAARQLQFVLDTDDPLEARRFVRDTFGWRVGVPIFTVATLRGVAVAEVAPAVEVPVFLYGDGDNREVAVFVYSYALLDQVPDRLRFDRPDYDDLDIGDPVVRRVDATDTVLWRDRDDIYVAVTDIAVDALTSDLTMAR